MRIKSADNHKALRYSDADPKKKTQTLVPDCTSASIFISDLNSKQFAVLLYKGLTSIKAVHMSSHEPVCSVFSNPFPCFLVFPFASIRAAGVPDLKCSAGLRKSKICFPLSAVVLCDVGEIIWPFCFSCTKRERGCFLRLLCQWDAASSRSCSQLHLQTVNFVCTMSEAVHHHHDHSREEQQSTDGGCNARPQAIPRRFPGFEVIRRKVVLSTHLNPASIWLWGSCKERGRQLWDNRNNRYPGSSSAPRKHWTFSPLDVFLFLCCVDWRFALLLADLTSFTELLILLLAFPAVLCFSPGVSSSLKAALSSPTYCLSVNPGLRRSHLLFNTWLAPWKTFLHCPCYFNQHDYYLC